MTDFCEGSTVKSVRRFYLLKRKDAMTLHDEGLAAIWQGKQQAAGGTALADDFPQVETLATHGYTTVEDIDGAGTNELRELGFTIAQAEEILTALEALL